MTLRILHVVPSYLPAVRYGGPIFAVHGLCRALVARGNHVEVFTTNVDGVGNSSVPLGMPVLLDGVRVRYFPSRCLRRLFWSPLLGRALLQDISKFDVVHLHSVFLWPTWAAARAARNAGVPYLVSPRGMLVKELIEQRSPIAKTLWINLVEKRNLARASAIHVTSELEADELRRFGWRLPPVVMISNGVEESEVLVSEEPSLVVQKLAAEQPFVLFLGRISWKKGLDRLLKAFARTTTGSLVIVGPDDENLTPSLAKQARELEIEDRVRFLSRAVLGADKEYLYARAQVFILPSYSENFGNTALEAMRRGVPVIVTPEVGASTIVRDAKAGLVVKGDIGPLSVAIGDLLQDWPLARLMGEAGRRHVAAYYGWPRVAERMEQFYASLGHRAPVRSGGPGFAAGD